MVKVNCANKEICTYYDIKKFPTIKVFINGKLQNNDPGRELESILEYMDKVQSPNIVKINNLDEANNFAFNYGDVSFILFDHDETTKFYECLNTISEENYKSEYYFGFVPLRIANYNRTDQHTPRLQVTITF